MSVIGVVGLGAMGLGIAQVFAAAGFAVVASDAHVPTLEAARERMEKALAERVRQGKLTQAAQEATLANLTLTEELSGLAGCSLVIEAIIEDFEAKASLLAALEAVLPAGAILATNTSSIPVHRLASRLSRPEALLALHFFNPPTAMKLVELAPHAGTFTDYIKIARQIVEKAGKTVVECPDRPGFVVNRCARPFYGEALAILAEGRSALEIDAAMLAGGYRLGPLSLIDLIGADINLAATQGMSAAMGQHPRYHVFSALVDQVRAGLLGRKSGAGFVFPQTPGAAPEDAARLQRRIEATLINEAHYLLAEGGVSADGIDTAMRLGLNFPRGPFEMLRAHGRDAVLCTLAALHAAAPEALKPRYRPAPNLEKVP